MILRKGKTIRAVRIANKTALRLADHRKVTAEAFAESKRSVRVRKIKEARVAKKVADLDAKMARILLKLDASENAWIASRLRKRYWNRKQNKLQPKNEKWKKKLGEAKGAREHTEKIYTTAFKAKDAKHNAVKTVAVLQMNQLLARVVRKLPKFSRRLQEQVDDIKDSNRRLATTQQVATAQLDALKTKIGSEASGTDLKNGAYRLLLMSDRIDAIEDLVRYGNKQRVEELIAELLTVQDKVAA